LSSKKATYKYPKLRIAIRTIFFRKRRLIFQNIGMGIVAKMKSVMMLIAVRDMDG
jgi:hypothetical protein